MQIDMLLLVRYGVGRGLMGEEDCDSERHNSCSFNSK